MATAPRSTILVHNTSVEVTRSRWLEMTEDTRRINVTLPTTLLEELDSLVPAGKRSQVIAKAVATYLSRLKVLAAIRETQGAWRDEDHPELATPEDVSAWVRALRSPSFTASCWSPIIVDTSPHRS